MSPYLAHTTLAERDIVRAAQQDHGWDDRMDALFERQHGRPPRRGEAMELGAARYRFYSDRGWVLVDRKAQPA